LLPATWKGCKIVEDTWSGYKDATITVERGPAIRIINPRLKESHQFEDIFILIFTHKQWKSVQAGEFVVSAASIGPGELDRNTKYVFAEPPQMINPDLEGAKELENIMTARPLHAF
jgi:hypothetical protein